MKQHEGNSKPFQTGIHSKLDYLKSLGVDSIWLSPIYESPMADFGYDISNHTKIDPMFGNLEDADALIEAVHSRGLQRNQRYSSVSHSVI